jgi:hypothetical protein
VCYYLDWMRAPFQVPAGIVLRSLNGAQTLVHAHAHAHAHARFIVCKTSPHRNRNRNRNRRGNTQRKTVTVRQLQAGCEARTRREKEEMKWFEKKFGPRTRSRAQMSAARPAPCQLLHEPKYSEWHSAQHT